VCRFGSAQGQSGHKSGALGLTLGRPNSPIAWARGQIFRRNLSSHSSVSARGGATVFPITESSVNDILHHLKYLYGRSCVDSLFFWTILRYEMPQPLEI
jgi:hypothetical protein